jgi:hypothetical protein
VAGCCEYGDEPSGCGATELVSFVVTHGGLMVMVLAIEPKVHRFKTWMRTMDFKDDKSM